MSKVFLFASLSLFVAMGLILTGCSKGQPDQPSSASPVAPQGQPAAMGHEGQEHQGSGHTVHQQGEPDHAAHAGHAGHSEYDEQLSQLSADDRALAEKQKVCPVSGESLGAMGTPYKVSVNGREVLLCCQGCEGEIKANPEKYLAKLPQ